MQPSFAQLATMNGARLEYVVVPIDGSVTRPVTKFVKGEGLVTKEVEQDGGFMVYFPRGHVLRLKDKESLVRYNLHKKPKIINIQGLADPNTPIGQLIGSQDERERTAAMQQLQREVIALATAHSGRTLMPEQIEPLDVDEMDGSAPLSVKARPPRRKRG